MKNLTHLADVIGPRLTGSTNLRNANEWAAGVMKSYGLTNVRLEPWTIPLGWERGTAAAKIVEPNTGLALDIASSAWAPGTKGKVMGDVVILRGLSKDDQTKYKGKLKNAIILQSPPSNVAPITDTTYTSPGGQRGGAKGGKAKGGDAKGGKAKGGDDKGGDAKGIDPAIGGGFPRGGGRGGGIDMEFLRAEGVACILRDSAKPHGLLVTGGSWRGAERANAAEPVPSVYTSHDHYSLLWRLASRPAPAVTRVEIEITNKFIPGPVTVYNTVGEIRGSEKPDEFVVCGAHLDSWDLGQGATDNGTGSCVVLETARIIMKSGIKPKRTIRFVLFSGEEQGLLGSAQYVAAHRDEMEKTSLAIIDDTGTGKVVAVRTQNRENLRPIYEREFLPSLKELGVMEVVSESSTGSDQMSFERAGVPGTQFKQYAAEYRFTHHTQSDTLDKAREPDLIQGAQCMAVAAMRIANLDSLLPREAGGRGRRGGGGS
jgi:hypothetical protein